MDVRDRVKELRRVRASELRAHPSNWRVHPATQRAALSGVLAEVGYADALLARELPDGSLELVDGHLRKDITPDAIVPVLVLDLTEAEAGLVLATLDPLAALATADSGKLDELLRSVQTGDQAVADLLAQTAVKAGLEYGPAVDPAEEWQGMPEFEHEDKTAARTLHVHFKADEDVRAFAELVGQNITESTRFIWYPEQEVIRYGEAE